MESLTMHDLTAAYALDALDADEVREYEKHLATCERCREELAHFAGAAGALAFAVDSPAPSAELRTRILDAARAERPNVVPMRPGWTRALTAIAAVAALAAIGFGIRAAILSDSLDNERNARQQADRALRLLADPTASRFTLAGKTTGSLVVARDRRAALIVPSLARAPSGKTYEAWVIENGTPKRAGTFTGGGNTSVLELARSVPSGAIVAVTIERRPGADRPSGPVVASSKPV